MDLNPRRISPDEAEQKIPEIHAHLLALDHKGVKGQLTTVKDEALRTHACTHTHTVLSRLGISKTTVPKIIDI